MTPYEVLLRFPDRTRPFVTHYDGPAARMELSVATVANGVAKASGLLRDGLGMAPGATVSLDLPRHWQLTVWTLAALSAGARCGRDLAGTVDVRVVGPAGLAALRDGGDPRADEVLVSSCDAFGLPVRGGLPAGVIDVAVEARVHPDVFTPEPSAQRTAALVAAHGERSWSALRDSGLPAGVRAGQRLWVDEGTPDADLLEAVALRPLLLGGSVVVATGLSAADAARVRAVEGVQPPLAMGDDSSRD